MFPDPTESISEVVLPAFRNILVTHDGEEKSNKAINYAIYLSNLSGAEITILQIVNYTHQLENAYTNLDKNSKKKLDVSEASSFASTSAASTPLSEETPPIQLPSDADQIFSKEIERELIESIKIKIKKIKEAGCKNKVSYKVKTGDAVQEIVNEANQQDYDLLILTSSHLSSWINSLFSDARKIISKINTSVLIPS
jgi:nucleotide-binding universal stress UspA family protein